MLSYLTQHPVVGGNFDGSRDGRFCFTNVAQLTPPIYDQFYTYGQSYVGKFSENNLFGTKPDTKVTRTGLWFRFRIPYQHTVYAPGYNERVVFSTANLRLWTDASIPDPNGQYIGPYYKSYSDNYANLYHYKPGYNQLPPQVKTWIYNNDGEDAPIPEDNADALALLYATKLDTDTEDICKWYNGPSPNLFVTSVAENATRSPIQPTYYTIWTGTTYQTVYINTLNVDRLQAVTVDNENWVANNHVLIFVEFTEEIDSSNPLQYPGSTWIRFLTWSQYHARRDETYESNPIIRAGYNPQEIEMVEAQHKLPVLLLDLDYVNTYPTPYDRSVTHELSIGQDTAYEKSYYMWDNFQTVTITQDIPTPTITRGLDTFSTLNISDTNSFIHISNAEPNVEHSVIVNQAITAEVTDSSSQYNFDTLTITHEITVNQVTGPNVLSDLNILQDVYGEIFGVQGVTSDVTVDHDIEGGYIYYQDVESPLFIYHDPLSHGDVDVTYYDYLTIEQDLEGEYNTSYYLREVSSTLPISQEVSYSRISEPEPADQLEIGQIIRAYVVRGGAVVIPSQVCNDATLKGDTSWTPDPRSTFTLTFGVTTLVLPTPLFGNREEVHTQAVNRRNVGGEPIIYRDEDWPKYEIFRYTFDTLTLEQRDALIAFIKLSLGKPVTVLDHENREYSGLILNPQNEHQTVRDECDYTTDLSIRKIPE